MSVQCKYIIGLHRDKNPIIIGCHHNIACPLGCCPEIMNGSVNVYQICNNPNCCKKLIVPAGGTLVTCCSCQRRLLFKKASVELNLVVQFEASDGQSLSLTIFLSLLKKLYKENT